MQINVINIDDIRHGIRVANNGLDIAESLELSNDTIKVLYVSALFHDIGKAFLDQSILNKPGKLDPRERFHIEKHVIYSYEEVLSLGYSNDIALSILHHHENWDGSGYPKGIKEEKIPLISRILKICDVYDALTMKRPYRDGLSHDKALNVLHEERDLYDPKIYKLFIEVMKNKQYMKG